MTGSSFSPLPVWPFFVIARREALFVALISFNSIAYAAQDCADSSTFVDGLKIAHVTIENKNIFDSRRADEDGWIHNVANLLHVRTTDETIENQLLLKPGDKYSQQLIDENERLIRSNNYINNVDIKSEKNCNGEVDLKVISTDNWTLTPSVSVGHSGGVTRTSYEIKEANLFGSGVEVKLLSESNEFRDEKKFFYKDNNLFGGRKQLAININRNSDGFLNGLVLDQPFYQLTAESAWSLSLQESRSEEPIYENGLVTSKLGQDNRLFGLSYGWLSELGENSVSHYRVGWSQSDTRYFASEDYPSTAVPDAKMANYPYLQYQFIEDTYIEKTNFLVMGAVEDIALGDNLTITAGWQDQAFNSSTDGLVLSSSYSFGSQFSENTLGLFDFGYSQEFNQSGLDPYSLDMNTRIFYFNDEDNSYQFSASVNLSGDRQSQEIYYLGGDSGLKGYPVRYQGGDRRAVFGIEKRNYFKWYPLRLLKLGFASFAELGSAWDSQEQANFIGNVGFGLRLVSTRQSDSKVLHLDLAFPTNERDQVDGYQLYIKARSQF